MPRDTSEFPKRKTGNSREYDVSLKLAGFKTRKAKKIKNVKRNKNERDFKRAGSIQPEIQDSMMNLSSVQKVKSEANYNVDISFQNSFFSNNPPDQLEEIKENSKFNSFKNPELVLSRM